MQNNGFVKVLAVLFALVCLFYISFSFVSAHYENKAKEYALAKGGDSRAMEKAEQAYLDSMSNEKVWLWSYTLKQCRQMEIGLGLDLKGGMNVILEVSVPDVLRALAVDNPGEAFETALNNAEQKAKNSQDDVITIFVNEFKTAAPGTKLASVFASQRLKEKVMQNTSDDEVVKVLREEVNAAIDNSFTVLRTRIDRFGVVQPNVQKLETGLGRIMVELPGIKEPQRVRDLLSSSATLEFWETFTPAEVYNDIVAANEKVRNILAMQDAKEEVAVNDTTKEVATAATDTIAKAQNDTASTNVAEKLLASTDNAKAPAELTEAQMKENPILSLLSVSRANTGCIVGYAEAKNRDKLDEYFKMAGLRKDLSLKWGVKPEFIEGGKEIYALYAINVRDGKAPLAGEVVVDAKDEYDQYNRPCVGMTMNTEGARKWAQLTGDNINRCIAIVLDDYVYSAPNVNDKISGGRSQISGNFTLEETKDLANVLKSGKMPARTNIVNEEIVGPSLGQASINQGVISFVVAIVLLMIYMCVMYGVIPGMVANMALVLNIFFTLGVLASFQAALTLSGIAGIVLTLGMAVDANVLIYERTKEELRAGKDVKRALSDGYSNAFSAIFDSNFTSLITGVILFNFGTGPIRGFATTLMIGIIISFFTAVFMTRVVYNSAMSKDKWLNLTFTSHVTRKLALKGNYNFMKAAKTSFIVWGVLILACIVSFSTRGLKGGIDFTGGYNYVVTFEQKVVPENVESLLREKMPEGTGVQVLALGTDGKTVRISTNYRINETQDGIDAEIEHFIYEALRDGNLLSGNVSYELFIDRDNHTGGSIISSTKVGPSIASDIKTSAVWSVVLSLIVIGLYILFRFRNLSFSLGSTAALICDTVLILGAYSMLQGILPFSMEMDQTFIGAILTAIGYSINDKVVVFDRIREYMGLYPKRNTFHLFNDSLNTTLNRTLNTSISTLIVLLCIFVLGGDSIRSFAFAMILGVVFGTLSSIFIAAPIAYRFLGKKVKVEGNEE